ncbi:hypothetical protein Ctha_0211 [Chloroherpeton thalassium ATCC 35110]|uniref:Uncharacterized protein n=2 Tax=Chloroherpeton thalassium TaxID=100716 RepID=B3QTD6_CHLT3|nr:hypothetical protein Ctha_0211 [Chloroherpeton thalassium ATCC 35110]
MFRTRLTFIWMLLAFFGGHSSLLAENQAQIKPKNSAKRYPPKLRFNAEAFRSFEKNYIDTRQKYNFVYQNVIFDSVGCTLNQLTRPVIPIQLALNLAENDTATAILVAAKAFLDENEPLFHANSKQVVLGSLNDYDEFCAVLFERAAYGKHPAAGQSRGKVEFIVEKKTGHLYLLASTMTRIIGNLPDSATYPKNKLYDKLKDRTLRFSLGQKHIKFTINRLETIQLSRVCVYEKKTFDDIYDSHGKRVERRLVSDEPHLAYEVIIGEDLANPIATIFFDAITGEELAIDYPEPKW